MEYFENLCSHIFTGTDEIFKQRDPTIQLIRRFARN